MEIKSALFYLFSAVMLFAALRVITSRNPVHAALYLVLAFFQASGIWMLLKAEFLSITLVLVYVGAVMVLFLFVVMMLDINLDTLRDGFWKHFPLAATLGALVALEGDEVLAHLVLQRAVLGKGKTASVELLLLCAGGGTPDPHRAVFAAGDQCLLIHVLELGDRPPENFC